jgi:hypothetical protein
VEPLLLSAHVLAGILFVGPVAVTTSLFPRLAAVPAGPDGDRPLGAARLLHRVTRTYGLLALAVPVAGLVLAGVQGRLTDAWVVAAMVLTAVAGGLLALRIVPAQRDALAAAPDAAAVRSLRVFAGVFNLLWAVVVVLMVVRPGASS